MTELILVRHAKSDWGNPGFADHDRPLNERGLRDAPMMAARLVLLDVRVDLLISSTAVRARTTAASFGSALGVEVELDPELYLASASTLFAKALAAGGDGACVMLVAHDPGLSDLAFQLSDGVIDHMPTCAVARFVWERETWDGLVPGAADSWSIDTPRRQ